MENAVGYVKKNFLNGLDIPSFAAVNPAAVQWRDTVANEVIDIANDGWQSGRYVCLGQTVFSVIHTHVAIHVEEADGGSALGHATFCHSAAKLGGPTVRRQASQFAPERLDFGSPIQSQHPPQICWECSLSASGRLMRPQRNQQQCQQTGAQTIESGADAAVNFIGTLEDAALHQGWQGQQNSSRGTDLPEPNKGAASSNKPR